MIDVCSDLSCGACDACDEEDFDAHCDFEERCDCDACRRVRARFDGPASGFPRSFEGGFAAWALGAFWLPDDNQ